jgi:hypothetical protein
MCNDLRRHDRKGQTLVLRQLSEAKSENYQHGGFCFCPNCSHEVPVQVPNLGLSSLALSTKA